MPPNPKSGKTFEPYRAALATLARVGQLGFVVMGGALVGLGLGYGIDVLVGGRVGRAVGVILGLASGIWSAGRQLMSIIKARRDEEEP